MEDVTGRMIVLDGNRPRLRLIRTGRVRFMNVLNDNGHCVALALNRDDVIRIEAIRENR